MMPQGALVQQHAQVVFERPGYYRVFVIAEDVSGKEPIANGRMVRNQAAKELWLLVTPTGGRVTRDFNPALIPDGVPQQSGEFGKVVPMATCGESCPPPCSGCGCGGCANNYVIFEAITHFTDERTGTIINQPLKMATIGIERPTGNIVGVTDNLGRFRVNSCPAYPSTWKVFIYNHNSDVKVAPRVQFATTRAVVANINNTACGKVMQFVSGMPESYVFVNAAMAAANGKVFFGRSRPQVQYWLQHTVEPDDNANYSWWSDDIEMFMDDYLFPRGIFVAAHEYGHAFHEKALGGITGGGCPDPHFMSKEHNFGCAYSEGFANYFAVATRGSESAYYDLIESPDTFTQGAASEQAVAAFYFDVTDPVGTGPEAAWDVIHYPGTYISELIQTCDEFSGLSMPSWNRAMGVDAIIYCMERNLDPDIRSAHFMTGNYRFIWDFREGANEPGGATQASDVRRCWKHNLYMQ
jgi:hypothetical protein